MSKPCTTWDAAPRSKVADCSVACDPRREDHSSKMYHMCPEKPHQRHSPCRASSSPLAQLSARPTFRKWSTEHTSIVSHQNVAKCGVCQQFWTISSNIQQSVTSQVPFHSIPRLGSYDASASCPIRTAALMVRPYLQVGGNVERVGRFYQVLHHQNGKNCVWVKAKNRNLERKVLTDRRTSTVGTKFGTPQKGTTKNHQIPWVFKSDMFDTFPSQVLLSSSTFRYFGWFSPNYCSKSTSLLVTWFWFGSCLDYRSFCRSPFLIIFCWFNPHLGPIFSYLNPRLDWFVIEKQYSSLFLLLNFS